jgi:hypothetical protein
VTPMPVRRFADVRWWLSGGRAAARPLAPSVARCVMVITAMKVALTIGGLGRTIRWVRRRVAGVPTDGAASLECATSFEYAVAIAAALYPGRAMCLERSLALFYLARRAGLPVTYHHGVQPVPFLAHAWVEYGGHIINDSPEHVHQFQRFPQVCP